MPLPHHRRGPRFRGRCRCRPQRHACVPLGVDSCQCVPAPSQLLASSSGRPYDSDGAHSSGHQQVRHS
eukprot:1064964-Rhodomonas_salina.1